MYIVSNDFRRSLRYMKHIYKALWCVGLLHLTLSFIVETTTINLVNIFIGLVLVIGAFISYDL